MTIAEGKRICKMTRVYDSINFHIIKFDAFVCVNTASVCDISWKRLLYDRKLQSGIFKPEKNLY